MPVRHVHLFDPQLAAVGGHYFSHDRQLLQELARRSIAVSLYGKTKLDILQCGDVRVIPTFTQDIFHEVATDPIVWPMENFRQANASILADLQKLDTSLFSKDDLIYVPNLLQNQVQGLADWITGLPEDRRPTLALMFRYLNHAMDYVQKRQNKEMVALFYRAAVKDLFARHPRSIICADTQELAKAYTTITGVKVLELPNPMDVSSLLASATTRPPNSRPVVVYQGHTSPLRGFHFLPEIIQRCQAIHPRPQFVIQVQNRAGATGMGLQPVIEHLDKVKGPDVELVEGSLSQDAYLALLARADIILLPYTPTFYGHGSSGVFTEAASVGKVVVASANTVPARQGKEYNLGVVVADQWTPASMSAAVNQAVQRLAALRQHAEAGAAKFREENCAKVLWDKLLAAVGL